ncbi:MAG: hypothetical protein U0105_25435 [Candidatus Obscuribacterales bacterium]
MKPLLVWCLLISLVSLNNGAAAEAKQPAYRGVRSTARRSAPLPVSAPARWTGWQRTTDPQIYIRFGKSAGVNPQWHWQFANKSMSDVKISFTHNTARQMLPKATVLVAGNSLSSDLCDTNLDGKLKPEIKIESVE